MRGLNVKQHSRCENEKALSKFHTVEECKNGTKYHRGTGVAQ